MTTQNPMPGFLIIGAQKCGTSWLHHHLRAHPDLYLPKTKDQDFFSYTAHLESPGIDGYLRQFALASTRLAGEASASYFWTHDESRWCRMPEGFQTNIPGTIKAHLGPNLRIIVMVRDPVERALSAYAHYLAHGELDPETPFGEAVYYGGIVHMGFYARHMRRWTHYYPRDQIHELALEQVRDNPTDALKTVTDFLEVSEFEAHVPSLNKPVFPGLHQSDDEEGNRIISLPEHIKSDEPVVITKQELGELRSLYEGRTGF